MDSQLNGEVSRIRAAVAISIFEGGLDPAIVEKGRGMLDTIRQEAKDSGLSDADAIRAIFAPVLKQAKGCGCWTCKARRIDERNEEIRAIQVVNA